MSKLPYMQLYVQDFLRDLAFAPPNVVGAWTKTLCHLHQAEERGRMILQPDEWARLWGCSSDETQTIIDYLKCKKIARVTICPEGVTIENRRMIREEKAKESARKRKRKQRENENSHDDVTPDSRGRDQRPETRDHIPEGKKEDSNESSSAPAGAPNCPHQDIVNLYHQILPELRQVKIWSEDRKSWLRTRWREDPERQTLDWWRSYFELVRSCPHLMGANDLNWQADLEWLVRPQNFVKVLEGRYGSTKPMDPFEEFKRQANDK